MNREGHLFWSMLILIISMGGGLLYLLEDYSPRSVSVAIIVSIYVYMLGCIVPDFDHHKVQQKTFFLRWMRKITKHRGHWHSIIAMLIYGGIIFLVFGQLIEYWYFPVIIGMFGFFTHLLLDEIKNIKTRGSRAIKIF